VEKGLYIDDTINFHAKDCFIGKIVNVATMSIVYSKVTYLPNFALVILAASTISYALTSLA